jgi:hypothetical protein
MDVSELGLTKNELAERIIDRCVNEILRGSVIRCDEDGAPYDDVAPTKFARDIQEHIKSRIDERISKIAVEHVFPRLDESLENMVLQPTDNWGHKKAPPQTLFEYLLAQASAFLTADVNDDGYSREEYKAKHSDTYRWNAAGKRVAVMAQNQLKLKIAAVITSALKDANATVAEGIKQAVETRLAEIAEKVKITTSVDVAK